MSDKDIDFQLFQRDFEFEGSCQRCGRCCVLAKVFHYNGHKDSEGRIIKVLWHHKKATNDIFIKQHPIFDQITAHTPCKTYDGNTRSCLNHADCKRSVCRLWPLVPEDLEQVSCPGFKIKSK